ncbi:MAG TPA: hypothetical protein VM659_27685 [Dongiaceae bacterium]|nr:hypothetical protein [Dongiaceae bacterium]
MGVHAKRRAAWEAAGQLTLQLEVRARTHRERILEVLAGSDDFLVGQEVARRAGLPYKPALDALTYLYNDGKIARQGRKFTARWGRMGLLKRDVGFTGLEGFFRSLAGVE